MWWDTHLHLDLLGTDGPALLQQAAARGVTDLLAIGTDPRVPAILAGTMPDAMRVCFAVGLHPQELPALSDDDVDEALDALRRRLAHRGDHDPIVAVGETGLDARPGIGDDDDKRQRQRRVFDVHLAVARAHGLPLVLHGVRRDGAMLQALDDDISRHGPLPGAVWHGYSGSADTMKLAVARGLHISVGFMALEPRARRVREAIPLIPDDRLLLETDAPPMAPARLLDVAAVVAELRDQTLEHVQRITNDNAAALFGRR